MRPRPSVSIIVPAFNEEAALGPVLEGILQCVDDSYEIIVVDDGSTDHTAAIAAAYPVRLVSHGTNQGKGCAVRTGVAMAQGDSIVLIDADNTYPPQLIPSMVADLREYDMVLGIRDQSHVPAFNRVGNTVFQRLLRVLYGSVAADPLTGLYAVRARHLRTMKLTSQGFGIEAEITIKAARMGLRIRSTPIQYNARLGVSKLDPVRDGYRIFATLIGFVVLYNPTVTFLVPGFLLAAGGAGVMSLLLLHPVALGSITFSSHSMLVLSSVAVVGVQLMVFGFVTKLYACTYWMASQDWLTRFLVRKRARIGAALIGTVLLLLGTGWGVVLLQDWARSGFGDFTRTREAAFVSFAVIAGIQVLFSYLFISLFIRALRQEQELLLESAPAAEVQPSRLPTFDR